MACAPERRGGQGARARTRRPAGLRVLAAFGYLALTARLADGGGLNPIASASRRAFVGAALAAAEIARAPPFTTATEELRIVPGEAAPFNERREYLVVRLPNGLRAMLVSDAEATRAEAALAIAGAGQFADPAQFSGPDRLTIAWPLNLGGKIGSGDSETGDGVAGVEGAATVSGTSASAVAFVLARLLGSPAPGGLRAHMAERGWLATATAAPRIQLAADEGLSAAAAPRLQQTSVSGVCGVYAGVCEVHAVPGLTLLTLSLPVSPLGLRERASLLGAISSYCSLLAADNGNCQQSFLIVSMPHSPELSRVRSYCSLLAADNASLSDV
ncbi:hypothetical protein T492DRAFT_1145589 [Pavlovales sp. CCMP2436]|nr:hypothetical protein T492DRAFT_1145589 [Pavlovales sp. CCMP2436]